MDDNNSKIEELNKNVSDNVVKLLVEPSLECEKLQKKTPERKSGYQTNPILKKLVMNSNNTKEKFSLKDLFR